MDRFSKTFFRGCREPKYLERESSESGLSEMPIMSAVAFFPDERVIRSDNTTETSIVWNKQKNEALKRYAENEFSKNNHGGIQYGIGEINRVGAEKIFQEKELTDYVSFDESPTDENEFHGNIRFDVDYCLKKTASGKYKPNKVNLHKICNCFVINGNQVGFYTIEDLERIFPFLAAD